MAVKSVTSAFAQMSSNVNHLKFAVGALYERGLDATISYEHETRYHHAWEYFANGYIQWAEDPDAGHVTKQSFWPFASSAPTTFLRSQSFCTTA